MSILDIIIIALGVVAVIVYATFSIIKFKKEKKGEVKKPVSNEDTDIIDND